MFHSVRSGNNSIFTSNDWCLSPEVPEPHFKTSLFVPAFMTFICFYVHSQKTNKFSSSWNLSTTPSALCVRWHPKKHRNTTERYPTAWSKFIRSLATKWSGILTVRVVCCQCMHEKMNLLLFLAKCLIISARLNFKDGKGLELENYNRKDSVIIGSLIYHWDYTGSLKLRSKTTRKYNL